MAVLDKVLAEPSGGKPSKVVIVSQWTGYLDILEQAAKDRGWGQMRLDGGVSIDERQQLVDQFNEGDAQVLLLSLMAGGVGLNLVGANHIVMMDLPFNPSAFDQACDRVYRVGQTRPVFVHTVVCKRGVELWQLGMLEKKRRLAENVLEQSAPVSTDDILELFTL
jgi:transcription termination factor 2